MLMKVLNMYPKEVACDDAKIIGDEGLQWHSLFNIYEKIDEENHYFQKSNELYSALLWSILVGIDAGFIARYKQKREPCKKIKILDIIDLKKTKEHFIESIKDEEWQDYLKEKGETIVFD